MTTNKISPRSFAALVSLTLLALIPMVGAKSWAGDAATRQTISFQNGNDKVTAKYVLNDPRIKDPNYILNICNTEFAPNLPGVGFPDGTFGAPGTPGAGGIFGLGECEPNNPRDVVFPFINPNDGSRYDNVYIRNNTGYNFTKVVYIILPNSAIPADAMPSWSDTSYHKYFKKVKIGRKYTDPKTGEKITLPYDGVVTYSDGLFPDGAILYSTRTLTLLNRRGYAIPCPSASPQPCPKVEINNWFEGYKK